MNWIEILGYVGMAFVVSSFLFKNIKLLRAFNAVGAAFCLTYGILTKTYATANLNIVLFSVNVITLIITFIKERKLKNERSIH